MERKTGCPRLYFERVEAPGYDLGVTDTFMATGMWSVRVAS